LPRAGDFRVRGVLSGLAREDVEDPHGLSLSSMTARERTKIVFLPQRVILARTF
jgi:hypothetical protein